MQSTNARTFLPEIGADDHIKINNQSTFAHKRSKSNESHDFSSAIEKDKTPRSREPPEYPKLSLVEIKGQRYIIKDNEIIPENDQMRFHTLIKYCDNQLKKKTNKARLEKQAKEKLHRSLREQLYQTGEFKQLFSTLDPQELKEKQKEFDYLMKFKQNSIGVRLRNKENDRKKKKGVNYNFDWHKRVANMLTSQ